MSRISEKMTIRDSSRPVAASVWPWPPSDVLTPSPYFRWKAPVDWTLAVLLLIPGLVLLAPLLVLVRLTSRGPAIFSQRRVGKGGHTFVMYKIRTMRHDAEALTGPVWSPTLDPRSTRMGKLLRRLHLDELPQLFNVLRGEMSLIGPRPERPEFVRVLSEVIPGYGERIMVRPGITGLAQLNLPPDTDLDSVGRKLALDREYIERAGLWIDIRIALCTAFRIFSLRTGRLERLLGLWRDADSLPVPPMASFGNGRHPDQPKATPNRIASQAASAPRTCSNACRSRPDFDVCPVCGHGSSSTIGCFPRV